MGSVLQSHMPHDLFWKVVLNMVNPEDVIGSIGRNGEAITFLDLFLLQLEREKEREAAEIQGEMLDLASNCRQGIQSFTVNVVNNIKDIDLSDADRKDVIAMSERLINAAAINDSLARYDEVMALSEEIAVMPLEQQQALAVVMQQVEALGAPEAEIANNPAIAEAVEEPESIAEDAALAEVVAPIEVPASLAEMDPQVLAAVSQEVAMVYESAIDLPEFTIFMESLGIQDVDLSAWNAMSPEQQSEIMSYLPMEGEFREVLENMASGGNSFAQAALDMIAQGEEGLNNSISNALESMNSTTALALEDHSVVETHQPGQGSGRY